MADRRENDFTDEAEGGRGEGMRSTFIPGIEAKWHRVAAGEPEDECGESSSSNAGYFVRSQT
jgi:hypothetical protein